MSSGLDSGSRAYPSDHLGGVIVADSEEADDDFEDFDEDDFDDEFDDDFEEEEDDFDYGAQEFEEGGDVDVDVEEEFEEDSSS